MYNSLFLRFYLHFKKKLYFSLMNYELTRGPVSLFVLILGLFITACYRNYGDEIREYKFTEKLRVEPNKQSYILGDTIWIYGINGKNYIDEYTQEKFNKAEIERNYSISIYKLTQETKKDTILHFIPVNPTTTSNYNDPQYSRSINFIFACNSSSQDLIFGFIPKAKGIYSINPVNSDMYSFHDNFLSSSCRFLLSPFGSDNLELISVFENQVNNSLIQKLSFNKESTKSLQRLTDNKMIYLFEVK